MGALDGKIAIVTGGTSGIGEGIARAFVSEGAKVVIVGRREEEGRAIEKQIGVRFHPGGRGERGRRQGDGRSNCRVVRPPRLPRQQRRNSVADDQPHGDRQGDHRSGPRGQRPRGGPATKHAALAMLKTGPAASSISAAWRDIAAASRPMSIQPRKGPSAPSPALRPRIGEKEIRVSPSRPERS